ncbi:hypothetical protein [Flavobacterium sp. '19STA2R22 D10 B1']|uniref:hypothetical protein n=1 Tax=Flavobacterium aerium TaxID=3037261 RepID=UPI00278BC09C|nr:hypothetical protein [Flavobacterium sp. '19STA2R22 D10 B1']
MKKLALLVLFICTLAGCSLSNDDNPNFYLELNPVESATVPQSFTRGQSYQIKMLYKRPSTCHYFDGFYFQPNLETRTIAIQSKVLADNNCQELNEPPVEVKFDFYVNSPIGTIYKFKFFNGVADNGENTFIIVEVPVTE